MINLLPSQAAKDLRKHYNVRLWTLVLVFFFLLVTSSIILMLPTIFAEKERQETSKMALDAAFARPISKQADQIGDLVRATNNKLALIGGIQDSRLFTEVIEKVLLHKPSGIDLIYIDTQGGERISLRGVADKRSILLSFIKDLEEDPYFFEVVSPISNLINTTNIEFSIDLKMGSTTKNAKK